MKIKRYLILVLAISLLLTAACMFTATAEGEVAEETTAPDMNLKIYAKNLSLENAIYISYAVPVAGTESADSVKMLFWLTPQSEYTYGTQTYELSPEGTTTIGSAQYYVFVFDKLAAKRMAVDIYAKVYATDGENEYYSALDKYSILQYAYNKLGKTSSTTPTAKMANLLNGMLDYGAYAQEYFGFDTDRLANDDYYQIKVNGAILSDGATHGLYLAGTQVTATAPEKNESGEDFLYWQNSAGEQVSENASYTITVGEVNETYIAVYGIKEAAPVEPLIYTLLSDGTYSVKANPDVELPASVIIPSTYEGASVTAIEDSAFLDCTGITSILLPNSIKAIGNKAFSGCTALSELDIPETVKTIGTRAFYGCSGITEITIPSSVTEIGTQIFYKCDSLSTVYYNSTYADQNNPFLAEKSIETVVFGGSYVPANIAYNNGYLKNVIIEDGVQYVDDYAFYGCTNLASVTIGNSVTSIGYSAFYNCTGLTSITIPDSVTSIGGNAFQNCTNLTNITIPDGVTSIGNNAFSGCTGLKKVYYTGTVEDWCKISFASAKANPTSNGSELYFDNILVTEVKIPDSITQINYATFRGCTSLTSITIPDSVTSIGIGAFRDCYSLTNITIPDSVTSIGSSAFYGCTGLTSITIPDSVTSIGSSAFSDCTGLTSITIPDSVTSIGSYAFEGCTSLKKVYYNGTVEDWCKISFSDSSSNPTCNGAELYFNNLLVTELEIPDTITKINNHAFRGCTDLTSITISDSVTSIGYQAFYGCTSLASITLGDSVTSIGGYAFSGCKSLASITLGDSVTSIGSSAFSGCTSLTSITIPDSVTSIGSDAFYDCSSLASITIPDSVTSIDSSAFDGCTGLKTVYYTGTADQWAGISIGAFNQDLTNASRYYYSEAQPSDTTDQYWHYVDGTPTIWNVLIYVSNGDGTCYISDAVVAGDFVIPSVSPTGDRVTGIGEFAFINCTAPVSITIPSSMTTISKRAFYRCTGLTSIIVPDSVTSIGQSAFYCCTNLSSVILSDGLTRIGSLAFSDCTSLKYIMIPDSVTAIDNSAFYACDGLEAVYYGGTEADWANIYISSVDNSSLTNATRYYYSETEPTSSGNYWHYVDGKPVVWVVKFSIVVVSSYDNDNDGTNDIYTLANYLDPKFSADSVIKLAGGDHLATDIGVGKAERIKNSGIYHYYINLSDTTIDDSQKILSWEFTVAEAGVYEICFDLSMKDSSAQRGTTMQIDDGEKTTMDYTINAEFAAAVRDETHGAYMYGIPTVELTAGTHILKMTYDPNCTKTFHFRNIYLAKVS